MLYPLSYEGKVTICRDFSLRWLGKGYHKSLIGCENCVCENCGRLAGLARVAVSGVRSESLMVTNRSAALSDASPGGV